MPRGLSSKKRDGWPARSFRVARRRAQWTKYQDRVVADWSLSTGPRQKPQDQHGPIAGGAPRRYRLPAKVPHGRWKTMTFLPALRHDRIDAPWFIEGPIDGASIALMSRKFPCPSFGLAISSSWATSADTRAKPPSAYPFGRSCFPAKILTRTRLNRSLPSSSTCSESCRANR